MIISRGEKVFLTINNVLLGIFATLVIYPFIYVLSASLSSPEAVRSASVWLFPESFNVSAYEKLLWDKGIWIAYGNTLYIAGVGTLVNLILTVCGAYPLSKQRLRGRTFISFMITFTMWFQAGMIPFYLNLRDLNLLNKRETLIIAFGVATFNVIILRTFFQSVPSSLEESAKIDGANDLDVLLRIYLPLSKAALATVGLFYLVNRWNGYFWAMLILRNQNDIPLQVFLKKIIIEMGMIESASPSSVDQSVKYSQETIVYATIVVSIVPIILVYPVLQKYFVRGVMLGSVKG